MFEERYRTSVILTVADHVRVNVLVFFSQFLPQSLSVMHKVSAALTVKGGCVVVTSCMKMMFEWAFMTVYLHLNEHFQ